MVDSQRILEQVQIKNELRKKLQSACDELTKVADEVFGSPQLTGIIEEMDRTATVLTMIACLGFDGYNGLQHAAKLVPGSYGTLRKSRVCDIVNYFVKVNHPITCTKKFQEADAERLLHIIDSLNQSTNEFDIENTLRRLTEESGEVYTMFIAPPIQRCTNSSCRLAGHVDSLSPNHAPVDVAVFDLDGPMLASKLSLKCKSCSTIYNYNKYGNKTKNGERFYDDQRELIEN